MSKKKGISPYTQQCLDAIRERPLPTFQVQLAEIIFAATWSPLFSHKARTRWLVGVHSPIFL